jgi:hypothetical protein
MNVFHTTMLRSLTLQLGLILTASLGVACNEFDQRPGLTPSEIAP